MHSTRIDFKDGTVLVDLIPITVDEKGMLATVIAKQCSSPICTDQGRIQYRLLGKASLLGYSSEIVIELKHGKIYSITFLFDLIVFFNASILESKILKSCERSSKINFVSDHRSKAYLNCEWGCARFFYDARQGDLSLDIIFQCDHNKLP